MTTVGGYVLGKEKILSDKEIEIVKKICEKYDFSVRKAYKIRSVYKLFTYDNKCICLKKTKSGKKKIGNGNNLVEQLYKVGFTKTPNYIKMKNGKLYSTHRGYIFYAMNWVDGDEADLDDLEQAVVCAELLSQFHNSTKKIDVTKLKIKNNVKNWPSIFMEDIYALDRFQNEIENKRLKTTFDIEYKKNIDFFTNRGLIALNILNTSAYNKLKNGEDNVVICHDSYYYQNLIKGEDGFYIIDLNNLVYDLRISDLGKYIRRLMSKKSYNWDFNKCKVLIEGYNKNYHLEKDELKAMLALIIFPHRFCKLGRKRYLKRKPWPEIKYSHKLRKIVKQFSIKEQFINDYLKFIKEYE